MHKFHSMPSSCSAWRRHGWPSSLAIHVFTMGCMAKGFGKGFCILRERMSCHICCYACCDAYCIIFLKQAGTACPVRACTCMSFTVADHLVCHARRRMSPYEPSYGTSIVRPSFSYLLWFTTVTASTYNYKLWACRAWSACVVWGFGSENGSMTSFPGFMQQQLFCHLHQSPECDLSLAIFITACR